MIEDLVAVIDRSWSVLESRSGPDFVLSSFPFREQLLRDPRTSQILSDMRRENEESLAALTTELERQRATLGAIFDELVAQKPAVVPTVPDEHGYDRTEAAIRRRLETRPRETVDDAWGVAQEYDDDDRLGQAVAIIKGLVDKAELDELRARTDVVHQSIDRAKRARRIYFETSSGAALARVERDLADLHPPINEPNSHVELARLCRVNDKPLGRIYDVVFKNRRVAPGSDDAKSIEHKIGELRADLQRVVEEIRRRVGAERSLLSVVNRYRQKCQWYDAERLRALAENGSGAATPEDRLSETLATYLFDHGLNPLTRPLFGRLLPDIVDANTKFSFYVEAKQYKQGAPAYLLQGMQQVWDMLDHLRGSGHDVLEAFYVIYRRGGPRYSFPPRVQHRDRVVHIVVVDIAAPPQRGSNAPPTRTFEVSELLPGAAIPTGAHAPSTRAATVRRAKKRRRGRHGAQGGRGG
ncbi:MAG TPA: hypothetical protein VMJ10_21070 [Kofleriaceae bacterium]|nr:hypothetical protein [Kofleriaceae bacterium]